MCPKLFLKEQIKALKKAEYIWNIKSFQAKCSETIIYILKWALLKAFS